MEIKNKYGYVRVSSKTQESNSSIESQKQQLIQNGIREENIFVEIGSGANEIKNRSVFKKLINQKLKENDLLMVTKIDRCSRNTLEFLKLQDILFKKNITFVALDLPTSVDFATNKLMATTLSALWPNLKITDGKSGKSKEFRRLKKKESIRDGKQSLIKF
jgi:DNA invertase Pin-like site-specific DNA recombinase